MANIIRATRREVWEKVANRAQQTSELIVPLLYDGSVMRDWIGFSKWCRAQAEKEGGG